MSVSNQPIGYGRGYSLLNIGNIMRKENIKSLNDSINKLVSLLNRTTESKYIEYIGLGQGYSCVNIGDIMEKGHMKSLNDSINAVVSFFNRTTVSSDVQPGASTNQGVDQHMTDEGQ